MSDTLYWNILDDKRRAILSKLRDVTHGSFYLAGGTGLALQLGHRDSIDFDFFSQNNFETGKLVSALEYVFSDHTLSITQEEKNTLSCLIDHSIQCSFFTYPYPQVRPFVESDYFSLASIEDIGCMKLAAITSRSVEKDYVDLYFILHRISLSNLLTLSKTKHPTLDDALILKSLVYFDDVLREPIMYKGDQEILFSDVQAYLRKVVGEYFSRAE